MRTALPLLALLLAAPAAAGFIDPTRIAAAAPAPADEYADALAASRKVKDAAPATLSQLRRVPVEFAKVTWVVGYADELGAPCFRGRLEDAQAAIAHKKAYWQVHARALGRRLDEIAAEKAAQSRSYRERMNDLGDGSFDRRLGLHESARMIQSDLALDGEKLAVTAALSRVEAVLADIAADEKGADSGQALIDRKVALFETLRR